MKLTHTLYWDEEELEQAKSFMRVTPDQIRTALKHLKGPVDYDESIVMACANAVIWAMEAKEIASVDDQLNRPRERKQDRT